MDGSDAFVPVSLDPDPVIEAYKKDVDRTLLRENLKLTVEQRLLKMMAALRLVEELRSSGQPRKQALEDAPPSICNCCDH